MEWFDFEDLFLDDSLFSCLTPQPDENIEHAQAAPGWIFEENKLFENALAEFDPASPGFFENVASRVPWKSIEEIKKHYEALVEDVEMIESGRFPVPDYKKNCDDHHQEPQEEQVVLETKGKNASQPDDQVKINTAQRPRKKGTPWTEEEHKLFLMGLNKYGKGDWRSISRYYVTTKTPTQVASHSQKYFRRQNTHAPSSGRRRPSIHDIKTVNSTTSFISPPPLPPPQTQLGCSSSCINGGYQLLPFPHPYGLNWPLMFNNNSKSYYKINGFGQLGDFSNGQSSMVSPMVDSTLVPVVTNPMMTQPADTYNPVPYMLPSLNNNQWG